MLCLKGVTSTQTVRKGDTQTTWKQTSRKTNQQQQELTHVPPWQASSTNNAKRKRLAKHCKQECSWKCNISPNIVCCPMGGTIFQCNWKCFIMLACYALCSARFWATVVGSSLWNYLESSCPQCRVICSTVPAWCETNHQAQERENVRRQSIIYIYVYK